MSLGFLIKSLLTRTSSKRRRQLWLVIGLSIVTSFGDVVSLGAVLPFIAAITEPETVLTNPWFNAIYTSFGFSEKNNLVLVFGASFGILAFIAGVLRLLLLWTTIRLGNAIAADFSIDIYERTLKQRYEYHTQSNSSEIIAGITQKVAAASGVLISIITIITSGLIFLSILVLLIFVDPLISLLAVTAFGLAYLSVAYFTRFRLVANSRVVSQQQNSVVKSLQEGLGGIRDVIMGRLQPHYLGMYQQSVWQLQKASGNNRFMSQSPRYFMESLSLVLLAIFVVLASLVQSNTVAALPVLGMIALGGQRLLPIMQQLYTSWSVIAGSKAGITDILAMLNLPLPEAPPDEAGEFDATAVKFCKYIRFQDVDFFYPSSDTPAIQGASFEIYPGDCVGIIGKTGSGKSTLVDLLMSLLEPKNGQIIIDGVPLDTNAKRYAWRSQIAHVSQSVYIADTTIKENIAFGQDQTITDENRIWRALEKSQLKDHIRSMPEELYASAGERGIKLSGGQRQRLGVARALYCEAPILVLDEATSALDTKTEKALIEAILDHSSGLTLIMIAHRESTLRDCNVILEVSESKVTVQRRPKT